MHCCWMKKRRQKTKAPLFQTQHSGIDKKNAVPERETLPNPTRSKTIDNIFLKTWFSFDIKAGTYR